MGARSSNDLQLLHSKIGYQHSIPINGHQGIPYCFSFTKSHFREAVLFSMPAHISIKALSGGNNVISGTSLCGGPVCAKHSNNHSAPCQPGIPMFAPRNTWIIPRVIGQLNKQCPCGIRFYVLYHSTLQQLGLFFFKLKFMSKLCETQKK